MSIIDMIKGMFGSKVTDMASSAVESAKDKASDMVETASDKIKDMTPDHLDGMVDMAADKAQAAIDSVDTSDIISAVEAKAEEMIK